MTKDLSRRSSAASSAHLRSPEGNGPDAPAQDVEHAGDGHCSARRSPSVTVDPGKGAEMDGLDSRTGGSQNMTASNSGPSNPLANDGTGNGVTATAPYGTRSRNRTGTSRPNYAEDKELDGEYEIVASVKETNARKAPRGVDAPGLDTRQAANASRKVESDPELSIVQHHYKGPIPGTSTFSANPTTATASTNQPSKKRKAPGSSTTSTIVSQAQPPEQAAPPDPAVTRRASIAAQVMRGFRDSNMLSFDDCGGRLKGKRLMADDGTVLEVNDHVYLVCEPPGEPYYLGRIMEFLHLNNDTSQPIDALRLNWYYRPKDIGRKVNDTRQVFASMHSDISPLTSLRGKCQIKHKSEVEKLDELRRTKDCFWYEKLYDRYIHRFYDVIPTGQVINVPVEVKKVLDERWKYIVVEPGRGKELTSAVKSCKRCSKYCASNDSVDCAVCQNTYHMSCVNPPLLKKPSRGFAWACGPCSKAQEKKLEARNTPNISDTINDPEEDDLIEEEDDVLLSTRGEPLNTAPPSPKRSNEEELSIHPGTSEQIHQASLWLFRYLGIHCKVEDALDYDDRIYPRASSRLGPRHQANVTAWPGKPVEYVKPADFKKKYAKGANHKKETKLSKETIAALEADKIARERRPKWVMDEPPGYVHRGEDYDNDDLNNTAQLLFKLPEAGEISTEREEGDDRSGSEYASTSSREQLVHAYMTRVGKLAKPLGLPELSTNLLDVALVTLRSNGYNVEKSLHALLTMEKAVFKEPDLSPAELKRFEDGVAKFGSEWHSIKKHVKTVSAADIVRFYYTWKKTDRGKQVWGNYSGRKGKKEAKRAEATVGKLQDDVADEYDDSAFDNDKAFEKKRGFQCKFCSTRNSRQWRRAPNTPAGTLVTESLSSKSSGKEKGPQLMVALCRRCAELWRRYAIQWEDIDEVAKKVAQAGGRAWKRKIDEELLKELVAANEVMNQAANGPSVGSTSARSTPAPASNALSTGAEPPRKKLKGISEGDSADPSLDPGGAIAAGQQKKKILLEKPNDPPPPPELPKPKILPCAICGEMDPMGDQHLTCKECRMTVHRNCYGVVGENRSPSKWVCDMCSNDKNPQVSIQYKCILCPVEYTEQDFVEPPKISHKKKTEKERERDRLERENAQRVADFFRKKQEEMNKPVNPREPLKRTANNNWVHVTCAVFTPEVKFGNAKALEPSEGIPSIASAKYEEVCKACKQKAGACVSCHSCRASVHVECAHQSGYILGFDIVPVKGSRRDQFSIVNINGEVGTMTAAVWCKEHAPTKTIVHRMHDLVDDTGLNALQLYVQNFKQADLTLTGTVRKATLVNQSTKVANPVSHTPPANRRTSTTANSNSSSLLGRASISHVRAEEVSGQVDSAINTETEKTCISCCVDVSPKWWPCPPLVPDSIPSDPVSLSNGDHMHLDIPSCTDSPQNPLVENGGGHVALAAAALHQNGHKPTRLSTEFQCHKCHWKRIRRDPTPPPLVSPPAPSQREASRPTIPAPPVNVSVPDADTVQGVPSYAWQHPSPYQSNNPYNHWSHHSPVTQAVAIVNQLNGSHSPRVNTGNVPQLNNQTQIRQPAPAMPLSPHQNGQLAQTPNGYPLSPHRNIGSTTVVMPNGSYSTFASTRSTPQHLTNGGPPPRASEHPCPPGNSHIHTRPSFGPPQPTSPMLRELTLSGRETGVQQNNGVRQIDSRVNGGASASPSLRNLLS